MNDVDRVAGTLLKLPVFGVNVNLTLDELPSFILISPVISFICNVSYFLFCYSSVARYSLRGPPRTAPTGIAKSLVST